MSPPVHILELFAPYRRPILWAIHAVLVGVAYLLAFFVEGEFFLLRSQWSLFFTTLPLLLLIRLATFAWYHLLEGLWRYVSMRDIVTILKAATLSSLFFSPIVVMVFGRSFPPRVFLLDWLLCLALVGGVRLAIRAFRESERNGLSRGNRALIVGAGDAAEMLIREIERNPGLPYNVVGFVDDDPAKRRRRLHGREVLGTIGELPGICIEKEVQELLIAIPSASGQQMRSIIGACRTAGVEFRTIPNMRELLDSAVPQVKVRRVNIEDLLRREPVRIAHAEIEKFLCGKVVLVTGAGGSIGAELCRQVARFAPAGLILLDRSENGLFFLEMELREKFPQLGLYPVIGDVTDESRITAVLGEHRPQVVFHAAAHKHVPLMEMNKVEAVKNNVRGTMVVAEVAQRLAVEDFVMISTDKAVRPTSVMGATKRVAEIYVQALNARCATRFITVRFGNVLASEGSVLQVFQHQIEAGGPVTVTHPDMMRYFMTIPEASQLVLQAATQGGGGEIFTLDMGDPVRIVDLAKDLIALSGLDPERDIDIKFTGPRPGEKLYEELLSSETRVLPTSHEKIMVVEADPADYATLRADILELLKYSRAGEEELLLDKLKRLVPDYLPSSWESAPICRDRARRILLVENDPYTRTALKRILENGYQVYEAEDRRQALQRIKDCRPDLMILSFSLPGTNVRRLCTQIKGENGPLSVIILTESAEEASLAEILNLGADDRVYKPIPVNILESRVKRLLERGEVGSPKYEVHTKVRGDEGTI